MLAIGSEIWQPHRKWIWADYFIWFSPHGCKPVEMGSKIGIFIPSCKHSVIQQKPPTSTFAQFSPKFIYRLSVALKLVLGFTISSWSWRTKTKHMKLVLPSTWKANPYLCKFLISLEIFCSAYWPEFLRRRLPCRNTYSYSLVLISGLLTSDF